MALNKPTSLYDAIALKTLLLIFFLSINYRAYFPYRPWFNKTYSWCKRLDSKNLKVKIEELSPNYVNS